MSIKNLLAFIVLFLVGTVLFAQSNEIIDDVLGQQKLSIENGVYLALTASGLLEDTLSAADALVFGKEKGWIKNTHNTGDEMSLGEYSYLLMRGFSMSGGLMYTIFPSPRYASRELGYKGYISRDAGAYRSLSGSEALSIVGQIVRSGGE